MRLYVQQNKPEEVIAQAAELIKLLLSQIWILEVDSKRV